MTKTRQTKETAAQAYARLHSEAVRRLRLIEQAVGQTPDRALDWGDVGSLAEVVNLLGRAGHFAGVAELTEK